ncbi:T9SS type A sorting domain-containing protein [Phaeodactylibacter xiamenensis]|uniref:T9SS type A sorting domain-containing protein n=1 Tax=Phaeodactylibacter xiamenensis TaxID=1524460 RepID=UPI003BACEF00
MKKRYTFFFLIGLMSFTLNAQVTCDEPGVLLMDDLSAYATGDITFQSDDWDTWPGATVGAEVSAEQANTGSNSIKIDGNIDGQDALLLLGGQESGHYVLSWSMFVYDSTSAYFNLQHEAPTDTEGFWAFDVLFEGGKGILEKYDGSDDASFVYPSGTWFPVYLFIDIDSDYARLVINERTVDTWPFSSGSTESSQMHSINFYPQNTGHSYFIDDISLLEIPAAEAGQYCYTAEVLEEPGFYAVPELTCYGGSYDQGGSGSGFKAHWYQYTPSTDGIMSVSSCGGGVDSRVWIFKGADCENLGIVGVNDDRCDTGDGDDYASYREAVVTAGDTYYIMFDNAWSDSGFGFELALVEEAPAEGQFCESAEDIEPGEHEVGAIDGESAVAGPNINNTSGSTTNYAQSKWYQFTPGSDGYMSISACDFAASDTHFFVYTGDCSTFEGLNLVAQNDNGCGEGLLTSSLDSIEVTGGETYYIEWIDRWMDGPGDELYIWELGFDAFVGVEQDEVLKQSFTVFPNPASDVLNIRLEQSQFKGRTQVTLLNMLGQPLAERQLDGGEVQLQLPVHSIPAGTYQLRVLMGDRQATQTVLIK